MDNIFEINNCTLERVNKSLNEALIVSKNIPFQNDLVYYFDNIYNELEKKMTDDSDFLKDAECLSIYKLYQKILETNNHFINEGKTKISLIKPNCVLLIKCPSIFASYHYIVAVIDKERTFVDTYQSFGSTYRLRKVKLSFKDFEKSINYLNNINKLKNRDSFYIQLPYLIKIENILYGINIKEYISNLLHEYEDQEYEEELSDLNKKDIEALDKLNIPYLIGDNLKHNYSLFTPNSVDIILYSQNKNGGKMKKKYSKKRQCKKNTKKVNKTQKNKKQKK